ncbi:MAG: putative DNA binding domain-containing protein [Gammaproteobacteria bacterium]
MQFFDPITLISNLSWQESDDVEFKSAKGGLSKSLWETYSAMANTQGGVILLGVEDDGAVSGVTDSAKLKKTFWDTINNHGKVSINLLGNSDVVEIPFKGKIILAIHIPRATRYQRPIYLNQNPLIGTYRRNHEGDYRCTEHEVSRMLADRSEESTDSQILENFDLSDLDSTSLHQYRQRFVSRSPTHPWLSEDDKGLLIKLGGWRRDRKTSLEGLTVAGLLMFGRDEAIREALPAYFVDYREKLSKDPNIRWTDRLTIDGTWNANLFQFYQRVIQRLASDIKLPFQLNSDLSRKGETEVHEAIREALVNALIHADYRGAGGIVVEKEINGFTFSNPGTLLISLDQLLAGNISECRNKNLQTMFMMFGAAEKAGSGVDKIRRGWASQHWKIPAASEQFRPDRVCWQLPMVSLISEESLARLKLYFGDKFGSFSRLETQILTVADSEKTIDNARMRQITGIHRADITRVLQDLVAKGILMQTGKARGSRYSLAIEPNLGETHSVYSDFDSVHKDPDSVHKNSDSVHKPMESMGPESAYLNEIAAPARLNKRLSPAQMEKLITELCQNRWLTRKQLSELLQRNADGLRTRFLTAMVDHGRLHLKYPDKPNRVDQAYTSEGNIDDIKI